MYSHSNICVAIFAIRVQSQPCHWRNIKSVTKRDVSNQTLSDDSLEADSSVSNERKEKSVSDNISLFKSLRVLQEGEGEGDDRLSEEVRSKSSIILVFCALFTVSNYFGIFTGTKETSETCLKTSILSTLALGSCILVAILSGSLWMACAKLRYRKKDAGLYNAYINHKGQID